ncbi:MAG TPA: SigE family RNA polymerase sigma factor [Actinomycetota bacterium]
MIARPRLIPNRTTAPEFEAFFREQYPMLVRMLYLLTGSNAEAEDLAQEALARAFERWRRVRHMASPGGYVCRTALNLQRKRVRSLEVRARRTPSGAGERDRIEQAEQRTDVARALASIPVHRRQALVLTAWLELSAEEAGSLLGIKPSTVRSEASRARAALREHLEERDE